MNTLTSFNKKFKYGFTLIELLLVIGIIAILAAIVIVAINPTKQLGDARDSQRRSDVNTLLNATYQFAIDNGGQFPDSLFSAQNNTPYLICTTQTCQTANGSTATSTGRWADQMLTANRTVVGTTFTTGATTTSNDGQVSMSAGTLYSLVGDYLTAIPSDPRYAEAPFTNYAVTRDSAGRLTFTALNPEQETTISVTR